MSLKEGAEEQEGNEKKEDLRNEPAKEQLKMSIFETRTLSSGHVKQN